MLFHWPDSKSGVINFVMFGPEDGNRRISEKIVIILLFVCCYCLFQQACFSLFQLVSLIFIVFVNKHIHRLHASSTLHAHVAWKNRLRNMY